MEPPSPTATTAPPRKLPFLRRAWDRAPRWVRRPVVWALSSERVRLGILGRLGIRRDAEFAPLSSGGPEAIDLAFERLTEAGVKGDYLEFGLFRGYTFWYAQQAANRAGNSSMRFFGFDSFEGLPKVEGPDRDAAIFFSGDFRCTVDEVKNQLSEHGFDWDRATLVKGYFDASLTADVKKTHAIESAALVMIDCDLYQSTVPVLGFLADILQDGTILIFDDWYCFGEDPEMGEPRAFHEFLSDHPEWVADDLLRFPAYGRAFVMKRRDEVAPERSSEVAAQGSNPR